MKIKILIIDDEIMICKSLEAGLTDLGYLVATACDGSTALKLMATFRPNIVFTDMRLGNENGIELIDSLKRADQDVEIIVMTAFSDIKSAVSAIKKGAYDYINKPFELDQINMIIQRAYENHKMKTRLNLLAKQQECSIKNMIGECQKMREVMTTIDRLSGNDDVTVLIRGETGTGKELVADAIHKNSVRRDYPLLKINCGAIPATLVESELFGFEKNAFTGASAQKKGLFEIADGGSVFLDELGELPLDMQAKLLRFLEDRKFRRIGGLQDIEVDVRIIAATNKNLEQAIRDREFREDLYYRINVVPIHLPPLRERGDDILLLTEYFLNQFNIKFHKNILGLDEQCKAKFLNYDWAGNIRELRNVIERIAILSDESWIRLYNLPPDMRDEKHDDTSSGSVTDYGECIGLTLDDKMDCIEKQCILEALEKSSGNQTKASVLLGISRFTLKRKMEKHKI